MALFRFPLDNQKYYQAKITFNINITNPPGLSTEGGDPREPGRTSSTDTEFSGAGGGGGEAGDQVSQAVIGNQSINEGNSVTLYLPPSLQIQDGVQYENVDLQRLGAFVSQQVAGGKGALEAIMAGMGDIVTNAQDVMQGNLNQDMARALIARFASKLPDPVAAGVTSGLQTAPTPNTRAIFRSVNLREFTFIFKLQPRSLEESTAITNIIKFFRTELYPETIKEGATGIPVAYRFPNKFDIGITYGEGEGGKTLATKIKKCYLRNFSSNYNPNSMSMIKGGEFSETDISMTFIEETTLEKDDIIKGF